MKIAADLSGHLRGFNGWFRVEIVFLLYCLVVFDAHAADAICAQVQIRILQKLTMERQGFEATLQVANGLPLTALTSFNVTLFFLDSDGNPVSSGTDSTSAGLSFWYRPQAGSPPASNATIDAGGTRVFKWLIIPTVGAAQGSARGITYLIGAQLSYAVNGVTQTMPVAPDYVQVYPTPILDLEYFLPEQVVGQDPNTPNLFLPPIPFSLGVRILNSGMGAAKSLRIDSGQPQIVRSDTGLAISFKVVGSEVQGQPSVASLLLSFGDLPGNSVAVGCWSMETSLTGKFTGFNARFNHQDSLGGTATSLIRSVATYRLLGEVLQPCSNVVPGFLGYRQENRGELYLFPSNAMEKIPVSTVPGGFGWGGDRATLSLAGTGGLVFSQTEQASLKGLAVKSVTRSDGVAVPSRNAWVSAIQDLDGSYRWHYYMNLFDSIPSGGLFTYSIQLSAPSGGNHPPVIQAMPDHYLKAGEGIAGSYLVRASDQDGDPITLGCGELPPGATFNTCFTSGGVGSGPGMAAGLLSWAPSANDAGDYAIRFTATDGQVTTAQTMGLHLLSGSGTRVAAWRNKYWPGETRLEIIGDEANPARDGYPNLMKYAFGVDPTKAEGTLTWISTVEVSGTRYLALTYVGRADDPDLVYTVQASNTLLKSGTWTNLAGTVLSADQTDVPSGFQRVTVRDSQPMIEQDASRRYLRLKIGSVSGPPAGYCRVWLAGHGSTVIGAPLLRDAVAAGRVAETGSNQVRLSDVAWEQNQFVSASQPYYLEVVTGNLAGCIFPILGNSADTLVLESPDLTRHPLGDMAVDTFAVGLASGSLDSMSQMGDLVRVRQAWTFGALLGPSGSMGAINFASPGTGIGGAESVSVPDNARLGIHKRPQLSLLNGAGWLDADGTDCTHRAIWPGTALIVHRFGNAQGREFEVVGEVQSMPFTGFIPAVPALGGELSGTGFFANDLYFAPVIGEPVGVVDSGLGDVLQLSRSAVDRGDELKSFQAGTTGVLHPDASRLLYLSGILNQWQELGVTGTTSLPFEPGKGYLLRIKAGSPGGYWRLALPGQ